MKKPIAIILLAAMCLSLCSCSLNTVEGKGFDSPEDALLAYAEALKKGDVPAILSTFAIETFVENFDVAEYWDHIGAMPPKGPLSFNSIDGYTTGVNLINRQYAITNNLTNLYFTATMGADYQGFYSPITFNGNPYDDADELYDEIMEEDWMEILSKMDFDDDFVYPEDVIENGSTIDKAEEVLEKQCDYYGCDEIVTLALEIELDREDYLLCMDVARYDGKWYNLQQLGTIGALLGAPATGGGLYIME